VKHQRTKACTCSGLKRKEKNEGRRNIAAGRQHKLSYFDKWFRGKGQPREKGSRKERGRRKCRGKEVGLKQQLAGEYPARLKITRKENVGRPYGSYLSKLNTLLYQGGG